MQWWSGHDAARYGRFCCGPVMSTFGSKRAIPLVGDGTTRVIERSAVLFASLKYRNTVVLTGHAGSFIIRPARCRIYFPLSTPSPYSIF